MIEAGYEDGFSTTIWYNLPNVQRQQIAEMVQFALAPLNIEVEIRGLEWGEYLDRVADGEHDMFILGWVSVTGDADYGLFPLFHSTMYGAAGNRTFWSTPESDDLLERGRMSVDPAERLEIYRELQILLHAEAPWVFLNQGEFLIAASANVNGFTIAPAGHHSFRNVWGS
jgi:peptide/nickel transport system substrate-binding protein